MKLPALLTCCLLAASPLSSLAGESVSAKFQAALNAAKALTNVDLAWRDTASISDPEMEKIMGTTNLVRTLDYAYTASGQKFRAARKPISSTSTNTLEPTVSTFDGQEFALYDVENKYMVRHSQHMKNDPSEHAFNPLVAPFLFLSSYSDDCRGCSLHFTDLATLGTNTLPLDTAHRTNGLLEITLPGKKLNGQPTTWRIAIDDTQDAFTPRILTQIIPGQKSEMVWQLLNYTNLGAYHFPTRIEIALTQSSTSAPPMQIITATVTLTRAIIPDQIADSTFSPTNAEQSAVTIWDGDKKTLLKQAPLPPGTVLSCSLTNATNATVRAQRPPIYDESADGSKQVADALGTASKEHKRVLLMFGANWCGWCHKLHALFKTDKTIADTLSRDYVVALIDVNKGHNKELVSKYGNPTRFGLPVLVVLDADGRQLTTQDTDKLEEGDHHSPQKVLAFLKNWAPK